MFSILTRVSEDSFNDWCQSRDIEKLDAYFENDYDDSYTITIKDIKPIVKWVIGILEGKKDLQSKIITILNKYKNKIQSRDILTLFQSIE